MSGNLSGPNRGVGIGKFKRALIIAAWDGRCWICGNRPKTTTLDHVIPRLDGGPPSVENLRPACGRCNLKRDKRLRAMAGRGRREVISRDAANVWHLAYPLPRFSESGLVCWIDPDLLASLPSDLKRLAEGHLAKAREAVAA